MTKGLLRRQTGKMVRQSCMGRRFGIKAASGKPAIYSTPVMTRQITGEAEQITRKEVRQMIRKEAGQITRRGTAQTARKGDRPITRQTIWQTIRSMTAKKSVIIREFEIPLKIILF